MSRGDQIRDKDSVRRDCIGATIDDLDVTFGYSESDRSITMSLCEPHRPDDEPKFQFKLSRLALRKLRDAVDATHKYVQRRWKGK